MASHKVARPIGARMLSSGEGLRQGWLRERAIRCHLLLSLAGIVMLAIVGAPSIGIVIFAVFLVAGLATELINAAIEALLDVLHPGFHADIGAAKDMCSAGAFVFNAAAVVSFAGAITAG
jgi:diacylglycerol kinase